MDIRQLKYFREIVRQGSITKAAEVLHMAQPPLSQLLKKLEEELGTTLIHRYRKKWELTPTGELLYEYACKTLADMEDIKQKIASVEKGKTGPLTLGVSTGCLPGISEKIARFHRKFPEVKLNIITNDSKSLAQLLQDYEIDIAVMLKPFELTKYNFKSLGKKPYVALFPKSWTNDLPENTITLTELGKYPLIMLGSTEGYPINEEILEKFHRQQIVPKIMIESKDLPLVIDLVARELGVSIVPDFQMKELSREEIAVIEIEDMELYMEPVILYHKERKLKKQVHLIYSQ